jgi:TatD DNase family protein
MPLVDSHCHIQDAKFDDDREEVIARSLEVLDWLVVIGDDLPTSEGAFKLLRRNIYATVGLHPYYAATLDDAVEARLREMAAHENVVGLGEMGLDYFKYNDTPRDVQEIAFRRQLDLAVELDLPVVIHNRESTDDLCVILDEYADRLCGGVIHCFAGSPDFVAKAVDWGFHISFAGNVTFPKAEELRVAATVVPRDRLLVETDAPFLAPKPVRGKRCEPAHTKLTAEILAEHLGQSYDELSAQTASNAAALYRIPVHG